MPGHTSDQQPEENDGVEMIQYTKGGMTKKDYDHRTKANITGLVTEFTDQATLMLSGSVSEESQEKMRRLRVLVDHQMRVYKFMKRQNEERGMTPPDDEDEADNVTYPESSTVSEAEADKLIERALSLPFDSFASEMQEEFQNVLNLIDRRDFTAESNLRDLEAKLSAHSGPSGLTSGSSTERG